MRNAPVMGWSEEGIAVCTVEYDNRTFTGVATCHPDDMDMCSEKTGYFIAEHRALVEVTRYYRDELKHKLAALKQLYFSIIQSQKYNPDSYEAIMLRRQIHLTENDIAYTKEQIKTIQEELRLYLAQKALLHEKLRKNRKQVENKQEN